jgi:hypothetical protein
MASELLKRLLERRGRGRMSAVQNPYICDLCNEGAVRRFTSCAKWFIVVWCKILIPEELPKPL